MVTFLPYSSCFETLRRAGRRAAAWVESSPKGHTLLPRLLADLLYIQTLVTYVPGPPERRSQMQWLLSSLRLLGRRGRRLHTWS